MNTKYKCRFDLNCEPIIGKYIFDINKNYWVIFKFYCLFKIY